MKNDDPIIRPPRLGLERGFTLIEIMVATVIMVILMGIIFQLTASMADIWRSTAGKIGAFQGARAGFDAMARALEQATLMTYLDYVDNQNPPQPRDPTNPAWTPHTYARASELHFVSGPVQELVPGANAGNTQGHAVFFQAPLGVVKDTANLGQLNELLNAVGFYVEYTDDKSIWPDFIQAIIGSTPRYRFRLMQWIQPSEDFAVYSSTMPAGSTYNYSPNWFKNSMPNVGASSVSAGQTRPRMIAENVIALFIRPRLAENDEDVLDDGALNGSATGGKLAPTYRYDSRSWTAGYVPNGSVNLRTANFGSSSKRLVDLMRNQVPPLVDVVMVAIDPKAAERLGQETSIPSDLRVPAGRFELSANLFAPQGNSDLDAYEQQLQDANISYRVFRSTLTMKGAKWSAE